MPAISTPGSCGCSFPMAGNKAIRQAKSPPASPVSARNKSADVFGINLDCGGLGFSLGLRAMLQQDVEHFTSVSPDGAGS